jgi:hypothetical protein
MFQQKDSSALRDLGDAAAEIQGASGWQGILIRPDPSRHRQCIDR